MAKLIFILGHSCSGKTTLARKFIKNKITKGECWALLDKDTVGDKFGRSILKMLGLPEEDRDSPEYKKHVRDLEYIACLDVIREQLENDINVVSPGPWTKELANGFIFDLEKMKLPSNTKLEFVFLDIPEETIKQRMLERAHPRDEWKLNNWNIFQTTLKKPPILLEKRVLVLNDTEGEVILNKVIDWVDG